mmetsp:Transcript_67483/g.179846  ORF Transcript_67483/g.179846 Transcript_67483/m.179846 type:complete len:86 (+) Transcript_67483:15-272(+)
MVPVISRLWRFDWRFLFPIMSWLMETAHLCIAGIKLPRRTVALRTSGDNWRCNASFPTRMELIVSAFVLDQLQLSVSDANTLASV